jgi:hypothetical protein
MKSITLFAVCLFTALASSMCYAEGFMAEVTSPGFKIAIPNIPEMKLEKQSNPARPHLRLLGSEGTYTVAVLTPTTDAGMAPKDCASAIFQSIARRPGLSAANALYKARIDNNTFIAIYVSQNDKLRLLNTHLISGVGGTHCIEVQVSKGFTSDDDIEPWFNGFSKARIEPK